MASLELLRGSTGRTETGLSLHLSPVQHSMLQSSKFMPSFALNRALMASHAASLPEVI